MCRDALQIAAPGLFALDRFEQGFEVPLAETAASLALDDFVEERRAVLDGAREDLEHVALIVAIDQNAELAQFVDWFVDLADPGLQVLVVRRRDAQEVDTLAA